MSEKKDKVINQFILRMNDYEEHALNGYPYGEGCSKEIIPMIKAFFEKSRIANIPFKSHVAGNIENIIEIVKYLACNTHKVETINKENIESIKKIFEELEALYVEALHFESKSFKEDENLSIKIMCLKEIVYKNQINNHCSSRDKNNIHDGKIFQSYESLWLIIHKINTEWNELCKRGFSLKVFYDFFETWKYDRANYKEKTESEKLNLFMGLLDGTMKFQPLYEYKAVSYQVVPSDFNDTLISNVETKYSEGYQLSAK